jgi:hypothetical protein
MKRQLLLIAAAFIFAVTGWLVGRTTAQTRVADFELSIEAPRGEVRLMCSRGCDWPSKGAPASISFRCDSERCRWMINGRGPITLGFPL